MFDLRIPDSLASLPGRRHVCADDTEGVERYTKRCGFCKEMKDESAFSVLKSGGLRSYCKPCMVKKSTAWNAANKERRRASKLARKAAK